MSVLKIVIDASDFLKPILIKILPIDVLRTIKEKLLHHSMTHGKNLDILPFDKERYEKGINLIGNIKGDSGLGQSCRLVAGVLENIEDPVSMIEFSSSPNLSMMDTTYDDRLEKKNIYGINLFHINPHEFAIAYLRMGKSTWDYHYNIAYWLWELEEFPDEWVEYINLLDEIWTPAEYISESIRKKTDKPVITVPYHVTAPSCDTYDRTYFGIPEDKFLFLMMFDCGSMIERKNPKAVIDAFKKAFEQNAPGVGLVIKVNGGTEADLEQIKALTGVYENIYFINKVFSKLEINSLIKSVDVVVSLHRAEGFGLVMAEAMLNGIPCIATNWSANTEFMNSDVACMVDYELVRLEKNIGPYKKGNYWAEPDTESAAKYMKRLFEDRCYYKSLSEKAAAHVKEILSMDQAVKIIEQRVSQIYAGVSR